MMIKIETQLVAALERLAEQQRVTATRLVNDLIFAELNKNSRPAATATKPKAKPRTAPPAKKR